MQEAQIKHHLNTIYCPRNDCMVERFCKELGRTANGFLFEQQLFPHVRPYVVECLLTNIIDASLN